MAERTFGLFEKGGDVTTHADSVSYDLTFHDLLIDVCTTQKFTNRSEAPVELEYKYESDNAPHFLEVILFDPETGKKDTLRAKIRTKEKAAEKYDDAIADGNRVLMGKDEEEQNLYVFSLGYIKPKMEITIVTRAMGTAILETEEEEPDVVNFLYTIPPFSRGALENEDTKNVEVTLRIPGGSPPKAVTCLSHDFALPNVGEGLWKTHANLNITRDFEIMITYVGYPFSTFTVTPTNFEKYKYAGILTLMPSFGAQSSSGQELILIINCSESMNGSRMNCAVEALKLFLQSLDPDRRIKYNIIRFGSFFNKLFKESVELKEDDKFRLAQQFVANTTADGTIANMFAPIYSVIPQRKEDPRVLEIPKFVNEKVCTFKLTMKNYCHQRFFHCGQCSLTGRTGFCESCKDLCHSGHTGVVEASNSPTLFYCDCGSDGEHCVAMENDLKERSFVKPPPPDFVKKLFLFTDGEDRFQSQIETLVEEQHNRTGVRVFSFGIGKGINRTFLKKVADVSRGSACFIEDNIRSKIRSSVLRQLSNAFRTSIDGIQLCEGLLDDPKYNDNIVVHRAIEPLHTYWKTGLPNQKKKRIPTIFNGRSHHEYFFMEELPKKITVKYTFLDISTEEEVDTRFIEKTETEEEKTSRPSVIELRVANEFLKMEKEERTVKRIGMYFQIPTDYTSFFLESEGVGETIVSEMKTMNTKSVSSKAAEKKEFPIDPSVLKFLPRELLVEVIDSNIRNLMDEKALIIKEKVGTTVFSEFLEELSPEMQEIVLEREKVYYMFKEGESIDSEENSDPDVYGSESYEFALSTVRKNGLRLEYAGVEMRKDKTIVLAAVASRGMALKFADEKLRGYREVVLAAVRSNPSALQFASDNLKKDREIALIAVKRPSYSLPLEFVDKSLQKELEIVLEAVKANGNSLQFAHEEIKMDRYIVLKSLKSSRGRSIRHVHPSLLEDREFMLDAVVTEPQTLITCLGESQENPEYGKFSSDPDFLLSAISRNEFVLCQVPKSMIEDREFVLAAVSRNPAAFLSTPKMYTDDESFILDACERNSDVLGQVAVESEFRTNKELVTKLVSRNGLCYRYISSKEVKKDEDVTLAATLQNPEIIGQIQNVWKKHSMESSVVVLKAAVESFESWISDYFLRTQSEQQQQQVQVVDEKTKKDQRKCYDFLSQKEMLLEQLENSRERLECLFQKLQLSSDMNLKEDFTSIVGQISKVFDQVLQENGFRPFSRQWTTDQSKEIEKLLSSSSVHKTQLEQFRKGVVKSLLEPMLDQVAKIHFPLWFKKTFLRLVDQKNRGTILREFSARKELLLQQFNLFYHHRNSNTREVFLEEISEEDHSLEWICYLGCLDRSRRDTTGEPTGQGLEFCIEPHHVQKSRGGGILKAIKKKKKKKEDLFHLEFQGGYSSGVRNGHGVMFYSSKKKKKMKKKCEGIFSNGKLTCEEGIEYDEKTGQMNYQGGFVNGVREGNGLEYLIYSSSDRKKKRFSSQIGSDIIVFEGSFKGGQRDGRGEMYDTETGIVSRGTWRSGKLLETFPVSKFNLPLIRYDRIQEYFIHSNCIGVGGNGVVYKLSLSNLLSSTESKKKEEVLSNIRKLVVQEQEEEETEDKIDEDDNDRFVAVKIMQVETNLGREILFRKVKRGIALCSHLKSRYVLPILAFVKGIKVVGYVSDLCCTSVDKLINNCNITIHHEEEKKFEGESSLKRLDLNDMETKIRILKETSEGMKALHTQHVMHRDLKWGNVLISRNHTAQITDFDTLKEDETEWRLEDLLRERATTNVGTFGYIAPEVFLGKSYSLHCDVFSFSLMIYSLLKMTNFPYRYTEKCNCGRKMEMIIQDKSIDYHVANCDLRPTVSREMFETVPDYLIDIMVQAWNKNPLYRPSFEDICYRFELLKKKSFLSILIHVFTSSSSRVDNGHHEKGTGGSPVWICDQRTCILKPYRLKDVNKWLEKKFEGSKVVKFRHEIYGKIETDEDLEKICEQETSKYTVSHMSRTCVVTFEVELDKIVVSSSPSDGKNNVAQLGNADDTKELFIKKIKELEEMNRKLSEQVIRNQVVMDRLRRGNRTLREKLESQRRKRKDGEISSGEEVEGEDP